MPIRSATNSAVTALKLPDGNGMVSRQPPQPPSLDGCTSDDVNGGVPFVNRAAAAEAGPGIAIGDWDNLFNAVKRRLIRTVYLPDTRQNLTAEQGAARIRSAVLECVEALDQLHTTVTAELVRREALELEVFDAKASLAQIRAALLGTQEGELRALHLAAHDGLTLLPHRAALVERITHELERIDPRHNNFAVMFLDLDDFKPINEIHGHAAGDEMLQIVAARLRRAVRAQDFVSRVGGDEFACLIGGLTDHVSLAQLAEKIAASLSMPCVLSTLRLTVQVSIGIAICPAHGSSASTLLEHADLAMVAAKRQQLRYAFFSLDDEGTRPALLIPAPQPPQPLPE